MMWEEDSRGQARVYIGNERIVVNNGHNQLCAEYTMLIHNKDIMLSPI